MSGIDEQDIPICGCEHFSYWSIVNDKDLRIGWLNTDVYIRVLDPSVPKLNIPRIANRRVRQIKQFTCVGHFYDSCRQIVDKRSNLKLFEELKRWFNYLYNPNYRS